MVHKKRGRPRLRDEREGRFESNMYNQPSDNLMRRPLSYSSGETQMMPSDPHTKSSYRVLKSQTGPPPAARYMEHTSVAAANIYNNPRAPAARRPSAAQEPACIYLNLDLQVARASRAFSDAAGVPSVVARRLRDIVAPGDRDKVQRLQRLFGEQRQKLEPHYLPPIYGRQDDDRVIQSVGLGADDVAQIPLDRPEILTFQGPDGEQRSFEVRMGLAKKESTFFVAIKLVIPPPPPQQQPAMHQFAGPPYPRDAQYGFQPPPQNPGFAPPQQQQQQHSPFAAYAYHQPSAAAYDEQPRALLDQQHTMFRQLLQPGSGAAPVGMPPGMSQGMGMQTPAYVPQRQEQRQEFGGQYRMQTARNETPLQEPPPQQQGQQQEQGRQRGHQARQSGLQLPPIRTQGVGASQGAGAQGERSGRVDIGGLIEKPEGGE